MPINKDSRQLNIIRVPLSNKLKYDIKPNFKPNDMLYLEYLENKLKVKPHLRNINYVSKNKIAENTKIWDISDPPKSQSEKFNQEMRDKDARDRQEEDHEFRKLRSDRSRDDERTRDERSENRRENRSRSRDRSSSREHRHRRHKSRHRSRERRRSRDDKRSDDRSDERTRERSKRDDDDERSENRSVSKPEVKSESTTELEKMLTDIETKTDQPTLEQTIKRDIVPSLSDIEKGEVKTTTVGGTEVRDISHITTTEIDDNKRKRELLFKFEILRRSYTEAKIPEFNEFVDVNTLQQSYDDTIKILTLDSTVSDLKKYLFYAFMGTEWVLGNWFSLDVKGYAQEQMVSMNKYDKLLVELGEKSYMTAFDNWPVEVRLIGMIILNAVMFVVSRTVMKSAGLGEIANSINRPSEAKPKPKMKGPNTSEFDKKTL